MRSDHYQQASSAAASIFALFPSDQIIPEVNLGVKFNMQNLREMWRELFVQVAPVDWAEPQAFVEQDQILTCFCLAA